jgi:hypothetical protein
MLDDQSVKDSEDVDDRQLLAGTGGEMGVDSHMIGVGDQTGGYDGAVDELVTGWTFQVLDEQLSP